MQELFQILNNDGQPVDMEHVKYCITCNSNAPEGLFRSWATTDNEQRTLLHYAAMHGHAEALAMLISEIKTRNERLIKESNSEFKENKEDEDKILIEEMINIGEMINAEDIHGMTALHLACRYGHAGAVKCLIESGANIFLPTRNDEEPLIVAINNHTEEDQTDNEKLTQRIETIKILLELDAGIGINLVKLFKNTGIIPFNAFGAVNVIGSGLTRNDPGFELAICNVEQYLENLPTSELTKEATDQFYELCLQRISLCQKRLGRFISLKNDPQAVELSLFIRKLDHVAPKRLIRLCTRAVAKYIKTPSERKKLGIDRRVLPKEIRDIIEPANKRMGKTMDLSIVRLFHADLKTLLTDVQNSPVIVREHSKYRIANWTRNTSFAAAGIFFLFCTFYYSISDIVRRFDNSTNANSTPAANNTNGIPALTSGLSLGTGIAFIVVLFIKICCEPGCLQRFRTPDIENFYLPLNMLEEVLQNKLANIETRINYLNKKQIISNETANAFVNSNNTGNLKTAIEAIMSECAQCVKMNSGQANTLFFNPQNRSGPDDYDNFAITIEPSEEEELYSDEEETPLLVTHLTH